MNVLRLLLILFAAFLAGCGPAQMGIDPSKPHTTVVPAYDKNHIYDNTNTNKYSSLFITKVNGKSTGVAWRGRTRNVIPGKVTLSVEDIHIDETYMFYGDISFYGKVGEKYVLSSNIYKKNNKIVDTVFFIKHNGKTIAKAKSKKKYNPGRVTYLMIPYIAI